MPAQNTTRPQPIARPDTQQGIQPAAYQAKPARRTHRRLLTPPLAQKNGIDPIQLILPLVKELPAELAPSNTAPNNTAPNNTAPATIADYLIARFYPNNPQIIHARFNTGEVRLDDGTILTGDSPYMPGERIWYFRELADEPQLPSDMPVLYEDEHVLAIDKPHFLPTTPRGSYIAQTALTKLRVREQNPLLIPIHRLDRPTAGVLLFAKTVEARRPFQMMFQHRQVSKTYRAVAPVPADATAAEQALSAEGLQVRSHIQKIRDQLQVQQLSEQECAAQGVEPNTLTTVKILRTFTPSAQAVEGWHTEPNREWALYDLAPHTGKTHQLRAHLNMLSSPILGDVLYPQVLPDAPDRPEYPLQLLAYSLHFEHPITGERVDLYSGRSLTAAS
ncbi:pseudouridylate synthase [Rothia sp. HMSC066H02]|uniref:pseudouridine synthase n=1 Tax=unclassified Rothia (in: high G+C Gram-positive bacteria) TaxID=2689056 RepID=UPI0008A657C6|nr:MULTISPECIES: pseudouridine synthase [unclassified Rothia (in: high G+C Gram-positive bacteria)]OFO98298.1 pseudouridylate synthase [Rothia sp. HMSC065D09]OFP12133.1 pseudouridylate synthase [Rothia sp. HMSC066H02]